MRKTTFLILFVSLFFTACEMPITTTTQEKEQTTATTEPVKLIATPELDLKEANRLSKMPLECLQAEYPNKLSLYLGNASYMGSPKELHPTFYGCYDWHSSVHGHWSLVTLLKQFPELENKAEILEKLKSNITKEKIEKEVVYFKKKGNKGYERTYGWAWLLKLAEELHTWDDATAKELSANLQPLTDYLVGAYLEFLPKLNYPIRVGEHSNTAFGLSFAYDYALTVGNDELKTLIEESAKRFYLNDQGCPLTWEPGGQDFLSPCLQEADIMRKVLSKEEYKKWLEAFLPNLKNRNFALNTGKVSDRTDGKLVHLDGVNFSRAWCLYGIAETLPEYEHLKNIAAEHINHSLPSIVDENYTGTHWLGSFAIYSLNAAQ